ncbi:hypothetical protein PFISCL1PPCAC_16177, partial [Pristionchus fissidentatus]
EEEENDENQEPVSPRSMLGDAEAMQNADTQLKEYSAQLDAFYSKDGNRKQINKNEIEAEFADGHRVFAVCQATSERAEYTGEWQRVEILIPDEFATVRFLDSGGTDMVMYGHLFHIHPEHTEWRAQCVQLCVHGLQLAGGDKDESWTSATVVSQARHASIENFHRLMREDLPMVMSVIPNSFIPDFARDNFGNTPQKKAYERAGVIFVETLKAHGRNEEIVSGMCTVAGRDGTITAMRNPNAPFPRKTPIEF